MARHTLQIYSLLMVTATFGCVPRPEKEVVVYCSTDREYAKPILDAFGRMEGQATVSSQYDVESSKTLGLANRLFQERAQTRCDVFWSGEVLHTIRLQKAGLLEHRNWRLPNDWPAGYAASDGSWAGLGARGRVLLVNREKLSDKKTWPKKVSELSDVRWKNRCGIAKPLYGTTATHMAVMATQNAAESTDASDFDIWIGAIKLNAVVLSGNKQVAQAVATGELDWGLTDTDDAEIEIANGHPVTIVIPDQGNGEVGMLVIPGTVAVLRKAPHPNAANALANYLVSQKIESRLTMGNAAQFALWPGSEKSIEASAKNVKLMKVDFEKAAENWDALFKTLQTIFQ